MLLVFQIGYAAQDSWDRYKPTEIKDLVAEIESVKPPAKFEERSVFNNALAMNFPNRIKLEYTGETRDLSEDAETMFKSWVSVLGRKEEDFIIFEREMLFKDGDIKYWMPVQSALIPYFQDEITKGNPVTLYVMLLGGVKGENTNEWQWIIIVNEFRK